MSQLFTNIGPMNYPQPYDADALAIFTAFTTPPTTARKILINALVVALKAAGVWTKLDALYIMAAFDSQSAKINWIRPGTYDLTAVNSPSFTTDVGFANNSSNSNNLDTSFNPNTAPSPNLSRDDATIFAWGLDANDCGIHSGTMGQSTAAGYIDIYPRSGGSAAVYINDSAGTIISVSDASGLFSGSRTGASSTVIYRNGSQIGTGSPASTSLATGTNSKLLKDDGSGTGTQCYEGAVSCAGFGSQMDATAHAALYTALNTYMQAVCQTAYTGPEDVVASATAWYGLRALRRARIGANCVTIIRASDSAAQTFFTIPGGGVDVAGITTFLTSTTGKVSKIWDQTGNGNHLAQGTDGNRPSLTLNAIGVLPAIQFADASSQSLFLNGGAFNGGSTIAQPWTISAAFKDISAGGGGTYDSVFETENAGATLYSGLYFHRPTPGIDFILGAGVDSIIAKSFDTWYAVQFVANGASSDRNIDGVSSSVSFGSDAFQANKASMGADSGGGSSYDNGLIGEAGVWPVAFSSGDSSSMSANQHAYWGF